MTPEMFREVVRLLERGEPLALATVVRTRGSTPQKAGCRLLVRQDGTTMGTVGGGCVEGDVWDAATRALKGGGGPQLKHYALNEPVTSPHGMVCGGSMDFLIEPLRAPGDHAPLAREIIAAVDGGAAVALVTALHPADALARRLLVREDGSTRGTLGDPASDVEAAAAAAPYLADGGFAAVTLGAVECCVEAYAPPPLLAAVGGGHIGKALEPLAKMLGFRLAVIDDRPAFANRDRFVEADEVLVADFAEGLSKVALRPSSAVVVATRGHKYDDVALEAALRSRAGYVGLVSSGRKWALIKERLLARGMPPSRVAAVRAPVGLDIGAKSPEEIALSIAAEIVAWRRGRAGGPMSATRPAGPSR